MAELIVALDAGHGGINAKGRYTTAPSKQFFHSGMDLHNGGWFYEGVSNRIITDRVAEMLDEQGIKYIKVYHKSLDTSLSHRVMLANNAKASLFISNHSNASPDPKRPASGFEVFSSIGQTRSDILATILVDEMKKQFGNSIRYRTDYIDGDPDKEAKFTVLTRTRMPSILVENFFFDNPTEVLLLHDPNTIEKISIAQVEAIKKFLGKWAI